MEPTNLTCPRCGTTWKLIKAGDGPITCPHCKAPVEGTAASAAVAATSAPPVASPTIPATPPPSPAPAEPAPARPTRAPEVSRVPDSDDRELRRDYEEPGGSRFPPRRRRHPLLIVLTVLLILFVLLPVALFALLFAVCAFNSR
jgi:uncharacterized Zn finger protein (UPF0148 family)